MRKHIEFLKYYSAAKIRSSFINHYNIREYLLNTRIVGRTIFSANKINKEIYELILSKKPFMVGRFGANELSALKTFDFQVESKYKVSSIYMKNGAGFFSNSTENLVRFKDVMLSCIPKVDIIGFWLQPFEDYYLKKYGSDSLKLTYLLDLEPWSCPESPWSAALKGKKVLVIHPFEDTIKSQYARREKIFPGTDILPKFELKTLKAVQTIAGEKDERFDTWFDALEWMYQEAIKIDFDVAIIGCGAYGLPLAAKLKDAGKQAIHLAGATQLLFGIKGKRWEENDAFKYVQKFFNDSWVYPSEKDIPRNAQKVEGGCYWR